LSYRWDIITRPAGSSAVLDNSTSVTPSFIADVHGEYVVSLVVSDAWESGEAATVTISFENVPPVADAGASASVLVAETAYFNGSGSFDANLDPLTYKWSIVQAEAGSTAGIVGAENVTANFTPDRAGTYVLSLVVNDGFVDCAASNVTVTAISYQDAITGELMSVNDIINAVPSVRFKNRNMGKTLVNKINVILNDVDRGAYADAYSKLVDDVLGKTDGCAELGEPDKNDWFTDCADQAAVYPQLMEAVRLLGLLLP
jgi:hypothetical protein